MLQTMKHLICLSLLLPLLICGKLSETDVVKDFCHESNCTLNGHPMILTISCKKNVWQLQCREDGGCLNMSFTCLEKPKKTHSFQLSASKTETYCLNMNCQKTGSTNCDNNQISISSKSNPSYKIQLRGSGCGFVHQRADDQTGMFLMTNKTWIEALQYCRKLNSTLVEITNQTVQEAVTRLLTNKTGLQNSVWVGLERSIFGINPEWIWTSRNKTINPDWTINHPVDPLNNHCGKVVMVEGQVKLVDENCHESLPFICQGKLGL
ncbi:PREDICTED: uncharacterized protein LOC106916151 isoform X2 [Poecilia mexicana]|uniref:uncharacterized protein LOC106916151 isoform X2 n=1 Tax=Poecilia mexicana TaxID=48701 RepID=UPI00072ED78D|nr:PREDICTED: uncharacterized protein LOC106916151 isoform X2 [Poecilia mexicana]